MRWNKMLLWATLLFQLSCLSAQAETALKIFVAGNGHPTSVILLSDNPLITFNDGRISISYLGGNTSLLIDEVDHWEFGDASTTVGIEGVIEAIPSSLRLRFTGQNKVCIDNATESSRIAVYSIDGKAQPFSSEKTSTGVSISLNHLRRGTYIIKTEQQSFKIQKQ